MACDCNICVSSKLYTSAQTAGKQVPGFAQVGIRRPPWFDPVLFKRGQQFFANNAISVCAAHLVGLGVLLSVSSVSQILAITRKTSTVDHAYRRYRDTLLHVYKWYTGDIWDPNDSAYKSLCNVQQQHLQTAKLAEKKGLATPSQLDMLLTQWCFAGILLVRSRELGVSDRGDLEGFVHIWRTLGFILGLEDEYNLCTGMVEDVCAESVVLLHQVFIPSYRNPSEEFATMFDAILEASTRIVPTIQKGTFLLYVEYLMEVPMDGIREQKSLKKSWNNPRWVLGDLLHDPQWGAALRWVFNGLMAVVFFLQANPCLLFVASVVALVLSSIIRLIKLMVCLVQFLCGAVSVIPEYGRSGLSKLHAGR